MERDKTIDILKACGIILMVVGHANCPDWLHHYIYSFHMPLFFIVSGLFLKETSMLNPLSYYFRKLKTLYLPFVSISLLFLLLHNLFLSIGICNDIHETSSVYYSKTDFWNLSKSIIFFMAGHDNDGFLGPLWFVRSLFVGSILLCVVVWAYNCFIHSFPRAIIIAVITFFLIGGVMRYCDLSIPYLPKGGFREMMAAFFIGMGFLIKHFHIEDVLRKKQMIPMWLLISFLILYYLYPIYPFFDPESDLLNWIVLPITSLCGYATFFVLSAYLNQGRMANFMAFIGRNTWWILSLHILCFKFSMLIEVWLFNKDLSVLSSWPVDSLDNPYFFIIHTIVGVLFPICLARVWQKAREELVVKSLFVADSFCHKD